MGTSVCWCRFNRCLIDVNFYEAYNILWFCALPKGTGIITGCRTHTLLKILRVWFWCSFPEAGFTYVWNCVGFCDQLSKAAISDYGNVFSIVLNVILNSALIVFQNVTDCCIANFALVYPCLFVCLFQLVNCNCFNWKKCCNYSSQSGKLCVNDTGSFTNVLLVKE